MSGHSSVSRHLLCLVLVALTVATIASPFATCEEPLGIVDDDLAKVMQATLDVAVREDDLPYAAKVLELHTEGDWAWGRGAFIDRDSGEVVGTEAFAVLAKRSTDGAWRALLPSTKNAQEYNSWLAAMPALLLPAANREVLQVPESVNLQDRTPAVVGYRLPWAGGWGATLTQWPMMPSGTHVGIWAWDFDLWEGQWSGACNRDGWVVAAKAGTVVYAKDCNPEGNDLSSHHNIVIMEHSDGEYSWYLHIAEGSIPDTVRQAHNACRMVEAGTVIGREGDNGRSTRPHLHFMVTTEIPDLADYPESEKGDSPYLTRANGTQIPTLNVDFEDWNGEDSKQQVNVYSANYLDYRDGVVLYWDADYKGPSVKLSSSSAAVSDPAQWLPGFIDRGASSIRVDPEGGYFVELYSYTHLNPGPLVYSRGWWWNEANFDNDYFDPKEYCDAERLMNDAISKVKVVQKATYCANRPQLPSTRLGIAGSVYLLGVSDDFCGPVPYGSESATLLSEVSYPDGTSVSAGQSFVKTWRVRNSGTSAWDGYSLVFLQGERMSGTSPVSMATTAPGQEVDISVALQAPGSAGNKVGVWQIINRAGVHVPGGRLTVNVNVLGSTQQGHIAAFSADPPSPSGANTVRLVARVNWWTQFRSMRVLVDGQVLGEIGAPEHTFEWHADGASRGDHTLVLEVADQTDTSWSRPERRMLAYRLEGAPVPANHAPNRPSLSNPYDWYVYYSGNTAQLCAQANGDPDGDAITGYYFQIYESAQLWESGWVSSNCATTASLGPYTYKWRVKVRDALGAESDWSDSWHFTLVNPSLSITDLHFEPQDGNSERVKIRACTAGQGGVGITMRVDVNDATDGSGSGTWHRIGELGVPCFNDIDAPMWDTLRYGDGVHRVRVEAHGADASWDGAAAREGTYTLPHRRPASPQLLAPVPQSGDIDEAIFVNSRTIVFKWEPTIRATSYTLHVGVNPSPRDDPAPIYRQTFVSDVTENAIVFAQDFPTLYWQVTAANDVGTNNSGDQLFGIDRTAPAAHVETLDAVSPETVFPVHWAGSDDLSGLSTFDIQYLDSGRGDWTDWLLGIPASKTYELFQGQAGHTYSFRCRATDLAGNTGDYQGAPEVTIRIDPTARPQTPWWDAGYAHKRNIAILNNMPSLALPSGYPVHLHLDSGTTPTAAEVYAASQTSTKGNDVRVVANDATQLDRVVQSFSSTGIDIWFRTGAPVAGGSTSGTEHQLYYGNAAAGAPPADPNQVWYPYVEPDTAMLYRFQEGTGATAMDSSGYGRNATLDPSVTWGLSKFGNGVRFSRANGGDSRSLSCSSSPAFTAFTVEFWYKADADDDGRITGQIAYKPSWHLQSFGGQMRLDVWPCSTCGSHEVRSDFNLRNAPYAGHWNHIAVSFNGDNEVKFYINGALNSTKYLPDQHGIDPYAIPLEIGSVEGISQIKANMGAFRISNGVKTSFPYGSLANTTIEPSTALGATIAPPSSQSPDLVLVSVESYPDSSGGVLVQAVVRNDGDGPTENGFFSDLYVGHLPTGTGDLDGSIHFWVDEPIAAGQVVTLTTVITDTQLSLEASPRLGADFAESSTTLYVQIDSLGSVSEAVETNNINSGLQVCVAAEDPYEPDDEPSASRVIALAETQTRNLAGSGDKDWVAFEALAGRTYILRTQGLGSVADTYLYVYDTDHATLLAANDDYSDTLASQIEWLAPADGTYYALVQHWQPDAGGCGNSYELLLTGGELPVVWRGEAEDGTIVSPMAPGLDQDAFGCRYVACPISSYTEAGSGVVELAFEVPAAGEYRIWTRAMGTNWNSNSFFVSIDAGQWISDEIPMNNGEWKWLWQEVDANPYQLAAGNHVVRFANREANARIDAVLVARSSTFAPDSTPRAPYGTYTTWLNDFGTKAGDWTTQDAYPRLLGDVNGDGMDDIVGFGSHNVLVSLSEGNRFSGKDVWLSRSFCGVTGWTSLDVYPRFLADVNGDGKDDIVGLGYKNVFVALSNGAGFDPQQSWLDASLCRVKGWSSQNTYPRMLGDLNGDGKDDIVGFGDKAICVALSNGAGFDPQQVWLWNSLCRIKDWSSQDVYPRMLADVTGDGLDDIVGFGQKAICVAPSLGDQFGAQVIWQWDGYCRSTGWTTWDRYPRFVGDADGDGSADIVGLGSQAIQGSRSTGASFENRAIWGVRSFCHVSDWSSQSVYPRFLADVTGDGQADLVGFGSNGVYVSPSAW